MDSGKKLFREKVLKKVLKKRANNYKRDKIVTKRLYHFIKEQNIHNIMLFIPLKNEINISPLIKLLREKGYNLYVPYLENDSFRLVKYRLPLFRKKFKLKEPKVSYNRIKKIDLAIVPILGIDKSFKRVGFGKGMYDRFYATSGHIIDKTLFLQRDIYYSEDCITNNYDIKADLLCTHSIIKVHY